MSEKCKNCQKPLPENAKFCPSCGEPVSGQTVVCKNCDTENPAGAKFCKSCGSALASKAQKSAPVKEQPAQAKPFYLNPYFVIMAIALLAMMVATYYNFSLVGTSNRGTPAQNNPQSQPATQSMPQQTTPPPDPAVMKETEEQLKQNPNDVALNVQMGNLLFDSQKFAEAIPYYQKALEMAPHSPDVIVDLGVCYFNLDEFARAKEMFEQALQHDSNHVNALYNLGVVAVRLREMDVLMDAWSRLVEVAPNSPQAMQASQILDEIHSGVQQEQN